MLTCDITHVLGDFRLHVQLAAQDEIVVLFGPSGSGKSLTLQSLAGLRTPDSGSITLWGRTLFDRQQRVNLPVRQRRVGYMFQNYALFPHLSVRDNVGYGLHALPRAERARRAAEALAMVRLSGFEQRRPRELSGGQQQRVALARALAAEPELLLLDEPFAALDGPIRAELRQEFLRLRRRLGVPAIFVTHDLEEATLLADRLAVIIAGELRQVGTAREVLTQPRDRQVAELVQARNIVPGTVICQDATRACIRTALGDLATLPTSFTEGSAVEVVIRPEVLRIVRDDRSLDRLHGQTLLTGTASEIIDHGTRTIVYAEVNGQLLEIALSSSATQRLDLRPGQPLRLSVPPGELHVVRAG
jgi:molybdate transport system ATP-binding protein